MSSSPRAPDISLRIAKVLRIAKILILLHPVLGMEIRVLDEAASHASKDEPGETRAKNFTYPKLPYGVGALAPVLSRHQVDLHYNRHGRAYFEKLNDIFARKDLPRNLRALKRTYKAASSLALADAENEKQRELFVHML